MASINLIPVTPIVQNPPEEYAPTDLQHDLRTVATIGWLAIRVGLSFVMRPPVACAFGTLLSNASSTLHKLPDTRQKVIHTSGMVFGSLATSTLIGLIPLQSLVPTSQASFVLSLVCFGVDLYAMTEIVRINKPQQ